MRRSVLGGVVIALLSAVVGGFVGFALSGDEADSIPAQIIAPTPSATPDPDGLFFEPENFDPPFYGRLPAGYRIEHFAAGLESPTSLDGSEDGRIFVAEQFTGRVRVITSQGLEPEPFYTVPDLYADRGDLLTGELGLVGVTVDPDASSGLKLYLYYSAIDGDGGRSTKLVRISERSGRGVDAEDILSLPFSSGCCHIGGALTWLADGSLLVGVGDHEMPEQSATRRDALATVLRITRDGEPAEGNPYLGGTAGLDPLVYASGLRNPFGVAAGSDGRMYVLDNGEFGDDRIFELKGGAFYGWPRLSVAAPNAPVTPGGAEEPLHVFEASVGLGGAVVYSGRLSALDGGLFFCAHNYNGALHWYTPAPASANQRDVVLAPGCSSGIRVLPDEYIYYLDYFAGAVMRIADASAPSPPVGVP